MHGCTAFSAIPSKKAVEPRQADQNQTSSGPAAAVSYAFSWQAAFISCAFLACCLYILRFPSRLPLRPAFPRPAASASWHIAKRKMLFSAVSDRIKEKPESNKMRKPTKRRGGGSYETNLPLAACPLCNRNLSCMCPLPYSLDHRSLSRDDDRCPSLDPSGARTASVGRFAGSGLFCLPFDFQKETAVTSGCSINTNLNISKL